MAIMIHDRLLEERLRSERTATGADRYDEVWEGLYMMAPMPNNERQLLVGRFTRILDEIVTDGGLGQVLPGANVSDRLENWEQNYRVPDVAVFLEDSSAANHGSFWLGGPDLAVEVTSQDDQTRDKLDFYAKIGTPELLIVDRDPWRLELYRLQHARLLLQAAVIPGDGELLQLQVLPMTIQLLPNEHRPRIQVSSLNRNWTI